MINWIPTAERLPEADGYYLVTVERKDTGHRFWYRAEFWKRGNCFIGFTSSVNVVAWANVGEIYEGGGGIKMNFKYYSTLRPVAPGTYPTTAKVVEIQNFDDRKWIDKIGAYAWGYIVFDGLIANADLYDLVPDAYRSEDKAKICRLLSKVLQLTRGCYDLVALEFDQDREIVTARFQGGGVRRINVAMDSGTAMIRDIMNNIGC